MLLTLEPLPAHEGDCLLLHWGTVADPKLAVIDGGPTSVYDDHLRPRLETIRANRNLAQLPIELVLVSHVDNDHIVGIRKLFAALKKEIDDNVGLANRHFSVKRLWHNTFNDVLGDGIDKYYQTLTASVQASVGGQPNPALVGGLAAEIKKQDPGAADAEETARDIALILAGHADGRKLRDSHNFLFDKHQIAALNAPFQKNNKPTLLTAEMTPAPKTLNGLDFRIVGPMDAEIQKLQQDFDKYIQKNGLGEASLLAAYSDTSITNLSSIVALAGIGTKRILLTGDARGDKTLAGLVQAGLLGNNAPMNVDILKGPHHGSDRNVKQDYFDRIVANWYVFSGNGVNGNPERDTLKWLTDSRGQNAVYDIVLTYPIAEIDENRKLDRQKKHKPWNHATDSLETFFQERAQAGFTFRLHEGPPIKIELGDEKIQW
jgi:hypothetical protein